MCNTMGAAYTDSFFAPTGYESTIVDAEDVFAVGFTSDYRLKGNNEEVIEYYGAAEPPVRCGESHLSGLTEPPHFVY